MLRKLTPSFMTLACAFYSETDRDRETGERGERGEREREREKERKRKRKRQNRTE